MNIDNVLCMSDSYKYSHWPQYPVGMTNLFSYGAPRYSQLPGVSYCQFFGMQYINKRYLSKGYNKFDIAEAKLIAQGQGLPFNERGWHQMYEKYKGAVPIIIKAVPEGLRIPVGNVFYTVEAADSQFAWVGQFFEALIERVWYPTAVATLSYSAKEVLDPLIQQSAENPDVKLVYLVHDFGARAATCHEQAGIGGLAHATNFYGSDTLEAIPYGVEFYNADINDFTKSIPAAEHSTITSWGQDHEVDAYANILRQFAKPGSILAVVSDSYNYQAAVTNYWCGTLKQQVIDSGATIVIRPDSGDPLTTIMWSLGQLETAYGTVTNKKGYKVLNHVRLIWGDGIDVTTLATVANAVVNAGYSIENVAFGMGGALLQKVNRDSLGVAMKASCATVNGVDRDVFKAPVADPAKASKKGRISLYRNKDDGSFVTLRMQDATAPNLEEVLIPVFKNGIILKEYDFAEVRANAGF